MFGNLSKLAEQGIGSLTATISAIESDLDSTVGAAGKAAEAAPDAAPGAAATCDDTTKRRQQELAKRREELLAQREAMRLEQQGSASGEATDAASITDAAVTPALPALAPTAAPQEEHSCEAQVPGGVKATEHHGFLWVCARADRGLAPG